MNTRIILLRHAESEKNLKDIHGGDGERLTPLGRKQVQDVSLFLSHIGVCGSNSRIVYPLNIQTKETAELLSNSLSSPMCILSDFKPLYLGVIHGLSNEEVLNRFPSLYTLMCKWRNKEIEICDLAIPGMESPSVFYMRGLNILYDLAEGKYNIFIATNSLYILLLNILFGNTYEKGGGYKHFNIQNCGFTMFETIPESRLKANLIYTDVPDVKSYLYAN